MTYNVVDLERGDGHAPSRHEHGLDEAPRVAVRVVTLYDVVTCRVIQTTNGVDGAAQTGQSDASPGNVSHSLEFFLNLFFY